MYPALAMMFAFVMLILRVSQDSTVSARMRNFCGSSADGDA